MSKPCPYCGEPFGPLGINPPHVCGGRSAVERINTSLADALRELLGWVSPEAASVNPECFAAAERARAALRAAEGES